MEQPKVSFVALLEEHHLSIEFVARFAGVSPWSVFKMASHRPVDRTVVEKVLADVSLLTQQEFSVKTVEVATCDPGMEPDDSKEEVLRPKPRPTFRQLLEFHDLKPLLLANLTGISQESIRLLSDYGIGDAYVIDTLLAAISKLTGFITTRDDLTCTILTPDESLGYTPPQQDSSQKEKR